jgi:hypothetical protein
VTAAALNGFHDTVWAAAGVAALGIIGALFIRTPAKAPAPVELEADQIVAH